MLPYPLVIFDFDGTLCATQDAIHYSFRKTFEQEGITPPSPSVIQEVIGTGGNLSELLPLLYPPLQTSAAALEEWVLLYRRIYDTDGGQLTTIFPGVELLLPQLADAGITCMVFSNKGQQAIEDALERFNLRGYFDLIIGDNPKRPLKKKPDPMAYEQVIRPLYPEVPASRVLMVGDTAADIQFANQAGLTSCWAAYGYGGPAACRVAMPTYTIHSLGQLYPLVVPGT